MQGLGLVAEHPRDAAGVILETGHVLAGKVKDPRRPLLIRFGDLEHFAKGGHLIAGHQPIGLGHLGAKRDHRDGKGDRAFGRAAQPVKDSRQPLARGEG